MSEQFEQSGAVELPALEVLLTSIFYLMTRHSLRPEQEVAQAISKHLEMLARHPECDSDSLKEIGRRLASQWREQLQIEPNTIECKAEFSCQREIKLH